MAVVWRRTGNELNFLHFTLVCLGLNLLRLLRHFLLLSIEIILPVGYFCDGALCVIGDGFEEVTR